MPLSKPALGIFLFAVVNGLIAQMLEGYAAHGLAEVAGDYAPTLFHMSAKYHMWHVLAFFSIALLYDRIELKAVQWLLLATVAILGVGTLSFCGGLYGVSFGVNVYFAVVGAILFQVGWAVFVLALVAALLGPLVTKRAEDLGPKAPHGVSG